MPHRVFQTVLPNACNLARFIYKPRNSQLACRPGVLAKNGIDSSIAGIVPIL